MHKYLRQTMLCALNLHSSAFGKKKLKKLEVFLVNLQITCNFQVIYWQIVIARLFEAAFVCIIQNKKELILILYTISKIGVRKTW